MGKILLLFISVGLIVVFLTKLYPSKFTDYFSSKTKKLQPKNYSYNYNKTNINESSSQNGFNLNLKMSIQSVWKNLRHDTSIASSSMKENNAGLLFSKDRAQNSRNLKNNSAGHLLAQEKAKSEVAFKTNTAGYESAKQRTSFHSMWQSLKGYKNLVSFSKKENNAGSILARDRAQDARNLKNDNAGYLLKQEKIRSEAASKINTAGYELSQQRMSFSKELSSF